MMTATGYGLAFPAFGIGLWGIHLLAVLAFGVGVAFLLMYVWKTWTAKQLRAWGIGLAVGGTIACLLTIGALHGGRFGIGKTMMRTVISDDRGGIGFQANGKGMSMMLRGRTGDDFDAAFLDLMIPHHESAIDMAELAKTNATHEELKRMADAIISAQQQEIDQMRAWQREWGYE